MSNTISVPPFGDNLWSNDTKTWKALAPKVLDRLNDGFDDGFSDSLTLTVSVGEPGKLLKTGIIVINPTTKSISVRLRGVIGIIDHDEGGGEVVSENLTFTLPISVQLFMDRVNSLVEKLNKACCESNRQSYNRY